MFGGVRIATVRAEERTRALAIEYRSLKACLLQHPDAMYDLLATTVARLRATSEQLAAANAR